MRWHTRLSYFRHIFGKLLLTHEEMSRRIITPWNPAKQKTRRGVHWGKEWQKERARGRRWGLIPGGNCSDAGVQQDKRARILTLRSNPITLPNWIGCVYCGDGIRALKCAQGAGESRGALRPPFVIRYGLQPVKTAAKKYPWREMAPVEL